MTKSPDHLALEPWSQSESPAAAQHRIDQIPRLEVNMISSIQSLREQTPNREIARTPRHARELYPTGNMEINSREREASTSSSGAMRSIELRDTDLHSLSHLAR